MSMSNIKYISHDVSFQIKSDILIQQCPIVLVTNTYHIMIYVKYNRIKIKLLFSLWNHVNLISVLTHSASRVLINQMHGC